jgi:hypothetical protein
MFFSLLSLQLPSSGSIISNNYKPSILLNFSLFNPHFRFEFYFKELTNPYMDFKMKLLSFLNWSKKMPKVSEEYFENKKKNIVQAA